MDYCIVQAPRLRFENIYFYNSVTAAPVVPKFPSILFLGHVCECVISGSGRHAFVGLSAFVRSHSLAGLWPCLAG